MPFNLIIIDSNNLMNVNLSKDQEERLRIIREDQETEWWRARELDDFDLKKKLLRVGCRPLKRKLLACQKSVDIDTETFM